MHTGKRYQKVKGHHKTNMLDYSCNLIKFRLKEKRLILKIWLTIQNICKKWVRRFFLINQQIDSIFFKNLTKNTVDVHEGQTFDKNKHCQIWTWTKRQTVTLTSLIYLDHYKIRLLHINSKIIKKIFHANSQ